MGHAVAAYVVTGGGLAVYALWTLLRGRQLSARVPAERRRWS